MKTPKKYTNSLPNKASLTSLLTGSITVRFESKERHFEAHNHHKSTLLRTSKKLSFLAKMLCAKGILGKCWFPRVQFSLGQRSIFLELWKQTTSNSAKFAFWKCRPAACEIPCSFSLTRPTNLYLTNQRGTTIVNWVIFLSIAIGCSHKTSPN